MYSRTQRFKECLDSCNMIDLGFHGPKFTWTNKRELTHLIQIRLDRCFANQSWQTCYPEASVQHLSRLHSDHCPVLLSLQRPTPRIRVRPFSFQPMWLSHPDFSRVVEDAWSILNPLHDNIDSFMLAASRWNNEVFGNIFHRKARLEARLRGIQQAMGIHPNAFLVDLEGQIRKDYLEVLNYEAKLWATKSRYN